MTKKNRNIKSMFNKLSLIDEEGLTRHLTISNPKPKFINSSSTLLHTLYVSKTQTTIESMPWGEGYMEKTGRKARNRTKSQEVTQNGVQGSASECPSRTVCECHCWPILVWVSRRSGGRKERPIWGGIR